MSRFLRPEAIALMLRWRDVLIAVVLVVIGAFWVLGGGGLLRAAGVVLMLGGAALGAQGIRRARFPGAGGGAGVVDVDERQITYFGPGGGGAVSIDALARVEIERDAARAAPAGLTWILHADGMAPLTIPGDAENAAALFDALAPLPGVDYARAIDAGSGGAPGLFVIWQKHRPRLH
ncbi:hypothetical protein [Oceaniglobus indicus]|uniref:hypothetical protein n=1 Tax=Oceaniglobus indicus TaxID=2047749 RepID=UPI000C1959A7|nr:hypothetical protein [Oceaniglobus indicus]